MRTMTNQSVLTVRVRHLLSDGDPALTDSIGEFLRNLEVAGLVLDFEFTEEDLPEVEADCYWTS